MRVRRRGAVVAAAIVVRLATVITLAVVLLATLITLAVVLRQRNPIAVRNVRIPIMDRPRDNQRVLLNANFFVPAGRDQVPAILLSPGFDETKNAVREQAEYLAQASFA